MKPRHITLGALIVLVAAASAGAGYWYALRHAGSATGSAPAAAANGVPTQGDANRKVLYWYDPMVPNQHFDKPGKSPFMDMQLTPKYACEGGDAAGVQIDSGVAQNLGIRLARVEQGTFDAPIDAVANVVFNGRDVAVVQARSGGFVQRVYARAPGDVIAQGAPLADLLVPEWGGAQAEFLAVLRTGDKGLVDAARERLMLLGMPAGLIARVERTGVSQSTFTMTSPIAGVIQSLDVRQGMSIAAGMTLAKINGLATVWLEAAVPESQGGLGAVGRLVEARLAAYPGETFKGKVIAVLPETDSASRTLKVRVELPNRDGRLKPGMFAQVRVQNGAAKPVLTIPTEAVIRTGVRNVVIVAQDGGRYAPVEVKVGQEGAGKTAILEGLSEGQSVVVSGQFLIDSDASLQGVLTRLAGAPAQATVQPASGASAPAALNEATGKVEKLEHGQITVSHGPVKSLGWGPMTMTFKLSDPSMATGIKAGDTVHFGFVPSGDEFVVKQLEKTGAGS